MGRVISPPEFEVIANTGTKLVAASICWHEICVFPHDRGHSPSAARRKQRAELWSYGNIPDFLPHFPAHWFTRIASIESVDPWIFRVKVAGWKVRCAPLRACESTFCSIYRRKSLLSWSEMPSCVGSAHRGSASSLSLSTHPIRSDWTRPSSDSKPQPVTADHLKSREPFSPTHPTAPRRGFHRVPAAEGP